MTFDFTELMTDSFGIELPENTTRVAVEVYYEYIPWAARPYTNFWVDFYAIFEDGYYENIYSDSFTHSGIDFIYDALESEGFEDLLDFIDATKARIDKESGFTFYTDPALINN